MESWVAKLIRQHPDANGLAVIVTNDYKGTKLPELETGEDGEAMKEAFRKLNIACHWERNATKRRLRDLVEETTSYFRSEPPMDPSKFKSITFVFSGHGADGDQLILQDGREVRIHDKVIKPLVEEPLISKIPKLFFVDACRGGKSLKPMYTPKHASLRKGIVSSKGNYILAYATIPRYVSYMSQNGKGSTWMQVLATELGKGDDSVQHVIAKVNKQLWDRYENESWHKEWQQPEAATRLNCGPLYLGAGQPEFDDTVETDRAILVPSRRRPAQSMNPDSLSSNGGNNGNPLQSAGASLANKTGSQESMDCHRDSDDFPDCDESFLQSSIWIFGSKFTGLITSNRVDEFSYAATVTSAFKFQKQSRLLTNPDAIDSLLQPPQTLRIERSHSKTLLNVAGILQSAFKINPAQFSHWLRGRYGKVTPTPEGKQALELLQHLVEKGARVATTAFDQQLAKSLGFEAISYSDKYKMDKFIRGTKNTVLHLHGHFERCNDVVFSQSDHDQLNHNEEYCSQVEAMFRTNNIVLVGFDWPCLQWDPHLDLIVETGRPGKTSGANHFILAAEEHCASYAPIEGVALVHYQGDTLTYMKEWWDLLLQASSSLAATDEVDETIETPPSPKRPKIATSCQDDQPTNDRQYSAPRMHRLSADDLLKTVVQEDLDEPELYDIAVYITSDIIEQLAIDLHGHGRQLDRIKYEEPKHLKQHAFRVLHVWYEGCDPEFGTENRKTLVREMYKLKKFRLAEAIAQKNYNN